MKYALLVAVCSFLMAGTVSAAPQVTESNGAHTVAPVPQGEALSLEDVLSAQESEASDSAANYGYWHCTAYAEGHGHSWGFDYKDVHYEHAYYGAMNTCEYNTHHHCHDVHCHYDYY